MNRERAIALVKAYGGAVQERNVADSAEHGMNLVEALLAEDTRLQDVSDQLGEGIHTAFRKGSDHPQAYAVWRAIDALPSDAWSEVLNWLRSALDLPPRS